MDIFVHIKSSFFLGGGGHKVKIKSLEWWMGFLVCFGNATKLHVYLTLAPQCVQKYNDCVNKDLFVCSFSKC